MGLTSTTIRQSEELGWNWVTGFKLAKKFREKFCLSPRKFERRFNLLEFLVSHILYIFTSPSAENREKFVHLGRLFLPSRLVGYSLCSRYVPRMLE